MRAYGVVIWNNVYVRHYMVKYYYKAETHSNLNTGN